MDFSKKNIYVVLGFARSGTSAIARGLKALGIELSDSMNQGNEKWNAKGFWEDTEIVYNINGKAFTLMDFAPYGIQSPSPEQQTDEKLKEIKLAAIELLKQRFAETDYWAFKDPSTVKLLHFWQDIFKDLNINENYVIAIRNPLASARSYQTLTGTSIEVGLLLWLMHVMQAMKETCGKKRVIVSYELLVDDPMQELNRMGNHLKIPELSSTFDVIEYRLNFIDSKLDRHGCDEKELSLHSANEIVPLCLRLYRLLMKLAKNEMQFEGYLFQIEWKEIQIELEKVYPAYCYIDRLLKENAQLKKKLRNTEKSILWKMLYPLRVVDQNLRARRQKSRESKRLTKAYG
ncbi:MAG TPA: sulfotransferase [Gammaproteobacteria bacterium]|nr:sulfotransferase [Gammaproteobacteria bacterium]